MERTPTGVGRYYRELALALAARDDLDVTAGGAGIEEAELPPAVRPSPSPRGRRARTLARTVLPRPRYDGAGAFDVVHCLHPWAPTPSRAPLVTTVHDLMPLLHPGWYRAQHRFLHERAYRHVARHAAHVVTDSTFVADQVSERLGVPRERVTVVPLGVGIGLARPAEADVTTVLDRYGLRRGGYVVALGAVSSRKNVGAVAGLMADPRVAEAGVERLVVVGPDGVDAAAARAALLEGPGHERVDLLGWRPDEEVAALLAGSTALVHPSLDEGFGFTPLEAMRMGVPAVVAGSGSLPEIVGSAGLVVDPADVGGWADAVVRLATDGALREAQVAEGARQAARFSWARCAEETVAVYRRVAR